MQSLVLCSSNADMPVAQEIRRYVEANCPSIFVQNDAVIQSANELIHTVNLALSDITLVLLSPDSIPCPWSRQQWEPALIQQPLEFGTALAFVLVRPCHFPPLFGKRKKLFYDLSENTHAGLRALRQWLLEQNPIKPDRVDVLPPLAREPAPEIAATLENQLLHSPGICFDVSSESALSFAHSHRHDFEGVFWLDCLGRDAAGVLGDIAHAVGLKLRGPTLENASALKDFCAARRCLFVFDSLAAHHRDLVSFQGYASVVFTPDCGHHASELPLSETLQLFAAWQINPEHCLPHLRHADHHLRAWQPNYPPETAQAIRDLGAFAFSLLKHHDRVAEAYQVLQVLSKLAWDEGNQFDLARWDSEKRWIQDAWGQPLSTPLRLGAPVKPAQAAFAFD